MPAAYTHITLVRNLSVPEQLKPIGIHKDCISSILGNSSFCELGAMSPDYPCILGVKNKDDEKWTEKMHFEKTGLFVHNAIEELKQMNNDENKKICLAWFMGYVSHMVADMVIHAVVESKVGTYDVGSTQHRICELNQDVYIFPSLNIGSTKSSQVLKPIIEECSEKSKKSNITLKFLELVGLKGLNMSVNNFWTKILKQTYTEIDKSPEIDSWHISFLQVLDKIVEEDNIPFLTSHFSSQGAGITHPKVRDVNKIYIEKLPTPSGWRNYDDIVKKAETHILEIWKKVSDGIFSNNTEYQKIINDWDFGTGRYSATGKFVYWS